MELEVLAIIKQLSCPSFFLTKSCIDIHWKEIPKIIAAANGHNFSSNELKTLNYFEKWKPLNANPILLARHFQLCVSIFFKEIPLSKIKYYAIRIEFQVGGSLHAHSFLWVLNQPALSDSTTDSFIEYFDIVVSANLPCKTAKFGIVQSC